jgi:hypothetical protein
MAVSISTDAGITTITFTYSASSTAVTRFADQVTKWLFEQQGYGDHGSVSAPRTFADLSNAEKLTMFDTYMLTQAKFARFQQDAVDGDVEKKAIVAAAKAEEQLA